jgi:hypothetical protein
VLIASVVCAVAIARVLPPGKEAEAVLAAVLDAALRRIGEGVGPDGQAVREQDQPLA